MKYLNKIIFINSANIPYAEISVDGGYCMTADPHINNWLHCNAVILFQEEESKKHIVRITIPEEDRNKKFTNIGIGYVQNR